MPDVIPFELPTGMIIRMCEECAMDPPRHQYFCSATQNYRRAQVIQELVLLEHDPTKRFAFWQYAERIGITIESSREDVAALRRELARARTKETIPPWKRRRKPAVRGT